MGEGRGVEEEVGVWGSEIHEGLERMRLGNVLLLTIGLGDHRNGRNWIKLSHWI